MPEHVQSLKELANEQLKERKPILDEYQIQEFESQIHMAMEYNYEVSLSVWYDGFTDIVKVRIHYLDNLKKQVRGKDAEGILHYINFDDIVNIQIHD